MAPPLRILHIEDNADDAELLRLELESCGFEMFYRRVETVAEMRTALTRESWSVVLCDFNLPAFNAYEVLRHMQSLRRDTPVIVVSGFIGEMEAVALMKAGAADYFNKDNMTRLGPAITREVKDAGERAERRESVKALAEHRAQLQELTAFLHQVREEERARIARELHDELGQTLTALRIDLNWLQARLPQAEAPVTAKIDAMLERVTTTVDAVRRISEDLRPGLLDDFGLADAIEHHVNKFAAQTGIACELSLGREHYELDDRSAITLFRVMQESLTNVARHAKASHVSVSLADLPNELLLIIKDDGCGLPAGESTRKTYGLLGMHERVKLLGGSLDISSAPGKGTRIEASLPCPPNPVTIERA